MKNYKIVFGGIKDIIIETCDIPNLKENQVLIETRCTLISTGTELTILSGNFEGNTTWDKFAEFPFEPGYNNIGEIIEVGKNIDNNFVGKRVATYNPHMKYSVAELESCRLVPKGISDEEAVFFTIAEIVMNGIRRGRVTWGESIVVYGLGLLGQLTVRISHFAGARPVIGLDIIDSRIKCLPDLAGIIGINSSTSSYLDKIKNLTNGRMSDVVFELTGNHSLIPSEFKALKKQGRFVVLSSPKGEGVFFNFHDLCNAPSYNIIGAHNFSHPVAATLENPWTQKRHAQFFFDLINEGSINVKKLITHKQTFDKAPELYEMLLNDKSNTLGVVLTW